MKYIDRKIYKVEHTLKYMIRLFSCFAGYGTDNFALKQLGIPYELVGFSEIDKYAIQCFQQNHGGENYGDITKIDWNLVPDFDLLTGGFPCQDVSVAGHQDLSRGRSILGFELTKALQMKQPRYFLFENVKGILSKKFEPFLSELLKQWESCGYKIYYKLLNTKDFGIPQNRERVFFVGFRKDIEQEFKFPEKEELKIFIKDVLEPEPVGEKYYLKEKQVTKLLEAIEKKMLTRSQKNDVPQKKVCGCLMGRDYKQAKVITINTKGERVQNVPEVGEANRLYDIEGDTPSIKKSSINIKSVQWDMSGKGYNSQEDRAYEINGVMCAIPNANPNNKVNIFEIKVHSIQPRSEDRPSFVKAREGGKSYPGGFGHLSKEDGTAYCLDTSNTQCVELINPYNLKISEKESGTIGQSVGTTTGKTAQIVSNCLTEAIGRQGSSKEFLSNCEKLPLSIDKSKFIDTYNHKVQEISPSLTDPCHNSLRLYNKGIFRRLTPKECFRLQGFLNDKIDLTGLSDTQCYKLAGNGQSVNVVKLIFKEMFNENN